MELFKKYIKDCELFTTIHGCTDEDIKGVMDSQNVSWLPEIYKSFLKLCGESQGRILQHGNFTHSAIYNQKYWINQELNQLEEKYRIPNDAFVFMIIEEGYASWYFHTANKEINPCIYQYREGMSNSIIVADTFTEFLKYHFENLCRKPS